VTTEGRTTFTVWREDDNGQRFPIEAFSDRGAAEACIARLTRVPHKQFYWIDEAPSDPQQTKKASPVLP
jgi:hypothetical protein